MQIDNGLIDHLRGLLLEALFGKGMNDLVCVIGFPKLFTMDKEVTAPVIKLDHIAIGIQHRLSDANPGNSSGEGDRHINQRGLFPQPFSQAGEHLGRAQNDTPVLPVLGDHLQHTGRKGIQAAGKPVLQLINPNHHTGLAVAVGKQLPPVGHKMYSDFGNSCCIRSIISTRAIVLPLPCSPQKM